MEKGNIPKTNATPTSFKSNALQSPSFKANDISFKNTHINNLNSNEGSTDLDPNIASKRLSAKTPNLKTNYQ